MFLKPVTWYLGCLKTIKRLWDFFMFLSTLCLVQDRRNPKSNFDDNMFVVANLLSRNVAI